MFQQFLGPMAFLFLGAIVGGDRNQDVPAGLTAKVAPCAWCMYKASTLDGHLVELLSRVKKDIFSKTATRSHPMASSLDPPPPPPASGRPWKDPPPSVSGLQYVVN